MRDVREWMSRTYVRVTGTSGGMVAGKSEKYANYAYALAVLLCLIASGVSLLIFPPQIIIFAFAVIWGIFFGVTFLFLMPAKMVAAIFGALLGSAGSDLVAAAGAITASNKQFEEIFAAITGNLEGFSPFAVWIFVFIVAVFCLKAFFEQASESGA